MTIPDPCFLVAQTPWRLFEIAQKFKTNGDYLTRLWATGPANYYITILLYYYITIKGLRPLPPTSPGLGRDGSGVCDLAGCVWFRPGLVGGVAGLAGAWQAWNALKHVKSNSNTRLLNTSDAADQSLGVDLGGRRISRKTKSLIPGVHRRRGAEVVCAM